MGLIEGLLYGGPGGPTRHGGAVRHAGLGRRCRGEVIPKLLQSSGYPSDKPMAVQDGLQVFSFGETVRALSRPGSDELSVRNTPGSHAGLANRDARIHVGPAPGLDRHSLLPP